MTAPSSHRIAVVGLGLIGGSFAKAYAAAGWEVFAWNRTRSITELAAVDTIAGELTNDVLSTCDFIIVTLYPEASINWIKEHAELIADDAIVIDAVGVKRAICEAIFPLAEKQPWTFVGGHPMAGLHVSGYANARADLYEGAPMVLVPPSYGSLDSLELIERVKKLLAPCKFASYAYTSAEEHDKLIAYTSQLAHVVSNAYVKSPTAQKHRGFSAGSYKDLTRVAQLNAEMWQELFLDNKDNLSQEIERLINELQNYKDALDKNDAAKLTALLEEGDRLKRKADES